jgi:hypothetical protein
MQGHSRLPHRASRAHSPSQGNLRLDATARRIIIYQTHSLNTALRNCLVARTATRATDSTLNNGACLSVKTSTSQLPQPLWSSMSESSPPPFPAKESSPPPSPANESSPPPFPAKETSPPPSSSERIIAASLSSERQAPLRGEALLEEERRERLRIGRRAPRVLLRDELERDALALLHAPAQPTAQRLELRARQLAAEVKDAEELVARARGGLDAAERRAAEERLRARAPRARRRRLSSRRRGGAVCRAPRARRFRLLLCEGEEVNELAIVNLNARLFLQLLRGMGSGWGAEAEAGAGAGVEAGAGASGVK